MEIIAGINGIHHVGYLVKNIDEGIKVFNSLGYVAVSNIIYDDYRKIDICFMQREGGYVIELISPKSKDSVAAGLIKRFGNSPYHICYTCSDIDAAVNAMRDAGFVIWEEPHEAVALNNKKVCFLMSRYIGIVELLEN